VEKALEEIVEGFIKAFYKQKDKKYVLYGLGENTEFIVKGCKGFQFIGLLDGYCTEGEFWGLPVLDLQKLEEGQVDAIIIIARVASARIIWDRIHAVCEEKHIDVYDMQGNKWSDDIGSMMTCKPVIDVPVDYVQRQIEDHEVISFDIFDTLIKRKTQDREVFFGEVAETCGVDKLYFIKYRMRAELAGENATAGIDELYQWIARNTDYDSDLLCRMKRAEMEKEKRESISCGEGKALFQYASKLGKKIYLVSDMYLGKEVIKELLAGNGINGYEELLISCEYGISKRQGLFDVLRQKTSGRTYLHIGDSEEADGAAANAGEMDAILIEESGKTAKFHYPVNPRYRISSLYQLGYTVFAPIMTEFCEWLKEEAGRRQPDCVLFLARDGYLFEKMYELAQKKEVNLPEKVYFMFSRSVGTLCYIENEKQLRYVAKLPYVNDKRMLMMQRFGLREEEVLCPEEQETAEDYAMRHQDLILRNGVRMRERFLKYYHRLLGGKKKVMLVDFVSTGSCQLYLESILKNTVEGAYFMRLKDSKVEKQKLHILSFLNVDDGEENKGAASVYFLLEQVIKAPTGTVIGYSQTGEPVLEESGKEEQGKEIREKATVQKKRERNTRERGGTEEQERERNTRKGGGTEEQGKEGNTREGSCTEEQGKLRIDEIQRGILDYYERYLNQKGESVMQAVHPMYPKTRAVEFLDYLNKGMAEIKIKGLSEYNIRDVYTGRETRAGVYL